jgi:hypothetical protein
MAVNFLGELVWDDDGNQNNKNTSSTFRAASLWAMWISGSTIQKNSEEWFERKFADECKDEDIAPGRED